MEKMILYLAEYGLYLAAFYLLYVFLFKGKHDHVFNRFYLLSSLLICLVLPFIQNIFSVEQVEIFSVVLNPIEIGAKGTSNLIIAGNETFPLIKLVAILYLLITAVLFFRFLYGIVKINAIKKNGTLTKYNGFNLVESDDISVPFSFFNNIYLPNNIYQEAERDIILEHEFNHIKYGHSGEKIFLLAHKVLFWWNPIAYKYFTELELVHEYQVDEKLSEKSTKKSYGQFLLSQFEHHAQFAFVNNISSHIKNRIIMLSSKNKTNTPILKWGSYLSLIAVVLFFHACTMDNEVPVTVVEENAITLNQSESPNENFIIESVVDTIVTFNPNTKEESIRYVSHDEKVFKNPDVMPIFGDCLTIADPDLKSECSQNNLLTFIYTSIIYPERARTNGTEGVVVAQFVIDKDGGIRSEKIVRSIGAGCDEMVLFVLRQMANSDQKWTPGQHEGVNVSTRYTLPVKFKLE